MGRRAGGATMARLVAAFARRPTWTQVELAAEVGVTVRGVRRHLLELLDAGIRIDRREIGGGHVEWTWRTTVRGPRRGTEALDEIAARHARAERVPWRRRRAATGEAAHEDRGALLAMLGR